MKMHLSKTRQVLKFSQNNKPTKVTNSRKLNVVVINQYNNENKKKLDDLTNKCLYTLE